MISPGFPRLLRQPPLPKAVVPPQPKPANEDVIPDDLPPPIYHGCIRLLDWKNTARGGMSIDVLLRDTSPTEIHPFKGLVCGKDHGQRLKVWLAPYHEDVENIDWDTVKTTYTGEAILMRWSDDSVNGMMIKMLLDDGPDGAKGAHPFDGCIIGRKEGELFSMASWALSDNETLQHPKHTRKRTPFSELSEVKQSNILCSDPKFVSFLARRHLRYLGDRKVSADVAKEPNNYAAQFVRAYLGIQSRAELSHETHSSAKARSLWQSLLRDYFTSDEVMHRR